MTVVETFVDEALAAFERTRRATDHAPIATNYRIGGRLLRVEYGQPAIAAALRPALVHLEDTAAAGESPSLVLHAWGSSSPGGHLPLPPWEEVGFVERGNVRAAIHDDIVMTYDRRPGVFSALDRRRGLGVYWVPEPDTIAYYERAEPFRRLLPHWLRDGGMFVAHAAAVGMARPSTTPGGVLLAGRAGSGKSTTSVLCIGSALSFLGDDFVLVDPGGPAGATLHSLYSSAKLNRDVLTWRPDLAAAVTNRDRLDREKAILHVGLTWPEAVIAQAPLTAIVVPTPTGADVTTAEPLSANEAFKAIVPDTLFRTLGPAAAVTRGLGQLTRTLPCYRLALGRHVDEVVAAVATIVQDGGLP